MLGKPTSDIALRLRALLEPRLAEHEVGALLREVELPLVDVLAEKAGIDPFEFDLPLTGFPEAASLGRPLNAPHTEEFLEQIAREYLTIGRGYARTIAAERHVSERTVVSWVEKARRQGILTRVRPGSYGGEIVQRSRRRPR